MTPYRESGALPVLPTQKSLRGRIRRVLQRGHLRMRGTFRKRWKLECSMCARPTDKGKSFIILKESPWVENWVRYKCGCVVVFRVGGYSTGYQFGERIPKSCTSPQLWVQKRADPDKLPQRVMARDEDGEFRYKPLEDNWNTPDRLEQAACRINEGLTASDVDGYKSYLWREKSPCTCSRCVVVQELAADTK